MLSQPLSVTFTTGEGLPISIETGKLARQADGAVTVRQGNCILLATVVANKEPREGQEFFPLSVDYQEKFASAGRIPGSFFKREAIENAGRPYFFARNVACVVLPLPGGPTSRMTLGGANCAQAMLMANTAANVVAMMERVIMSTYRCTPGSDGLRKLLCFGHRSLRYFQMGQPMLQEVALSETPLQECIIFR